MFVKKIISILLIAQFSAVSQTHIIEKKNLQAFGHTTDFDFSKSTFYNSYDTCAVSWRLIKDSMPFQWDISICFPTCYPVGVTNAQDTFLPLSKVFLNAHFYPNFVAGEGYMQMQITTNLNIIDTVTWYGIASETSNIESFFLKNKHEWVEIFDINGRKVESFEKRKMFFVRTRANNFKSIYVF